MFLWRLLRDTGTTSSPAIEAMDTDGDGVLSLVEVAVGAVADPIGWVHTAADGDGDGDVDIDDIYHHAVGQVVDGDGDGCWTTGELCIAAAVYSVACIPVALFGLRIAGSYTRETWMKEGRRQFQQEMLQAVAQ